jgi:hypothetical protein
VTAASGNSQATPVQVYQQTEFDFILNTSALTGGMKATGTLTATDIPHDGDIFTLDTKPYTFKTALTATEGEILIGGSAAVALDNAKSAVNHAGVPGTDYSCAAAHPTVEATTNTDTTQVFAARAGGVAGNSIATTVTGGSGHLSFGAGTLAGGTDAAFQAIILTSNDGIIWADAHTFASQGNGGSTLRATWTNMGLSIGKYVAMRWTLTGATASVSFDLSYAANSR